MLFFYSFNFSDLALLSHYKLTFTLYVLNKSYTSYALNQGKINYIASQHCIYRLQDSYLTCNPFIAKPYSTWWQYIKKNVFIFFPVVNWLTTEFVYTTVSELAYVLSTNHLKTWIFVTKACTCMHFFQISI